MNQNAGSLMLLESTLSTVYAWLEAINQQDAEGLLTLSDPNIEIAGPRSVVQGRHVLREWLDRAGIQLITQHTFARDAVVVVAQRAVWRSPETGEVIGEADVASHFRVDGKHVAYYARYERLDEALEKAGLARSDAIESSTHTQ